MKKSTYSRLLMAPLLMLLAVACAPDQFNQTNEYDDVYFTSADRSAQAALKTKTQQALIDQQQKQVVVDNYSNTSVDDQIVSKYNNGQPQQVTYFEDGPIVKSAQELDYIGFVSDYENGHLAHYELPLDWNTDWTENSFNTLMDQDFHFRLAWYDQYYLGRNFRMNQYLSGRTGRSRLRAANAFGGPVVGVGLGVGFNNFYMGFNNTAFLDLNPWGIYDPFCRPLNFGFGSRGFGFGRCGFGFGNAFYDPFYCPPFFNRFNGFGWRNGWRNNVFVNNNIFIDRRADRVFAANRSNRNVSRGPRVSTSRVATVRNEAINGASPATRSSRYVDNLSGSRSSRSTTAGTSRGRASLNNGGSTTRSSRSAAVGGSSDRSRVRTDAYNFNRGSSRASRSSAVRTNGSRSSSRSSSFSRSSSRSSSGTSTARSSRSSSRSSNPSFGRSSSSRSSYSRGSSRSSSRSGYSRGSSSSSRGSSYSRGSSSRSSSSSRGSYSRGSSSRSSSGSSRGSSSSRSSSGSSSRGSSSGSSRSSRGN